MDAMMMSFIGTKIIRAEKMTRGDYNIYQGWEIPKDENPKNDGYIVGYPNSKGEFNGELRDGCHHISWSPKSVFEASYQICKDLPFGLAIEAMKMGEKVARKGWNGKGMFCYYVPGGMYESHTEIAKDIGDSVLYRPYMALMTAQGDIATWSPSGSDALAEDWVIID